MVEYKLHENYLDQDYFNTISSEFINGSNLPWYYNGHTVSNSKYEEDNQFMFTHNFYSDNEVKSDWFEFIMKLTLKVSNTVNKNNLLRIKANLYTNQGISKQHSKHTDFPDIKSYTTAVYNFTTCNGGTILYINNKEVVIPSVENSLLVFDGNILHNGFTQTDVHNRVLINFDFQ